MAGQRGDQFLLKRGDGGGPETFTTVGGFRTHTLALNGQEVDATDKDSGGFRELLAGAGINAITLSGAGPIKDTVQENNILTDWFNKAIVNYQVIVPGIATFQGPFRVTQMQYDGPHDSEATWSLTLASAGTITKTAL